MTLEELQDELNNVLLENSALKIQIQSLIAQLERALAALKMAQGG